MATKITLADLLACDDGTVLVAKDAVDGSRRHISEVANGLKCGCICFGCGRALIAKNGFDIARRKHHFSHRPDELTPNCATAGETALHILGKEIIARHGRVTMPETALTDLDGKRLVVTPRRSIALTAIHLETAEGELVPDIIATTPDGRRLFIEIKNTHGCPPEKLEKLTGMDVDALEIDVSGYRAYPLDELDEIVLDHAPRIVIQSHALSAEAARLAEERQRQEGTKLAETQRLVAVYRNPDIWNHKKSQELVEDLVQLGLSDFLDLDDDRPSAFIVYRRQWQAVILDRLYKAKSELVGPMDFVESFSNGRWPKKEIAYTKSEHSKWIAANVAEEFKSPYEEVYAYLVRLRKDGAVREISGKRFGMEHDLRTRITAAIDKRLLPGRQRKELLDIYRDIGRLSSSQGVRLPDFNDWLVCRARYFGLTVEELLADEEGDFYELLDQIEAVKTMIEDMEKRWNVEPPDELAGLPMENLIARHGIASIEAEERAEAELVARQRREEIKTTARLRQEAADRVFKIEGEAVFAVNDVDAFLGTPLPGHDGRTPRELAAESQDGLWKVQAFLSEIRDARLAAEKAENLRKKMVNRLEDDAYRRIPRQDMAKVWLNSSSRELDGVKPVNYCKDEKSLLRCLEVLKDFVANEQKRRRR